MSSINILMARNIPPWLCLTLGSTSLYLIQVMVKLSDGIRLAPPPGCQREV